MLGSDRYLWLSYVVSVHLPGIGWHCHIRMSKSIAYLAAHTKICMHAVAGIINSCRGATCGELSIQSQPLPPFIARVPVRWVLLARSPLKSKYEEVRATRTFRRVVTALPIEVLRSNPSPTQAIGFRLGTSTAFTPNNTSLSLIPAIYRFGDQVAP